jgi:hypothetical protein
LNSGKYNTQTAEGSLKAYKRRYIMPAVTGDAVTNYLKAQASTQFGTRQLSVLTITKEGLTSGEGARDSLYSKIIRALQQTAEVWAVFAPLENGGSADSFNVIISADSQFTGDSPHQGVVNGGDIDNEGGYGVLETALNNGAGTTGIVVSVPSGFSAPYLG